MKPLIWKFDERITRNLGVRCWPFAEARKPDSSVFFEESSLSRPKGSGLVTKIAAPINFVLAP